jgi:hypothetical protein
VEPVDEQQFDLDDEGRLDIFGQDGAAPGSPWDEEVDAGWDPSDHPDPWDDCGDGPEAWLRSLPPDLRAEVEARPPVTELPWEAGPAAARASFAVGGLGDEMLPSWALGRLLDEATVEGYSALTDDELTGLLRGWQRQVSHCQSWLARIVAEIGRRRVEQSRRPGWSRVAEHVTDELAVELTLTGRSADRLRDLVSGLERLPEVNDALLSGFIDWARARVFVDELAVLDDAAAREIATALADPAAGWTTGQLRAALARAVLAADPGAAGRRKKTARKETRVELWREGSGNSALAGRELRPASAILLDKKLTSDAQWLSACGVPGTVDELRALAYTTLLSGRDLESILDDPASWPSAGAGPGEGGAGVADDAAERPHATRGDGASAAAGRRAERNGAQPEPAAGSIHLTMPASTLLGGEEPGEANGYGPVDAGTSRELAEILSADPATRWCLTVTGPGAAAVAHACARRGPAAGEPVTRWAAGLRERLLVLESGRCRHTRQAPGYVPPPRLRHLVMVRQRQCAFPGCRRPARQCDLDHTTPFENGGLTCECNLAPLCRRHHRAKQAPGWRLTQDQPGVMTWRLPSGRSYETVGEPYPV